MKREWQERLISAVRSCDTSIVRSDTSVKTSSIPRRAHSWADVYKLMHTGFIMINKNEDGLIEMFDWADMSPKPWRIVGDVEQIVDMIWFDEFPDDAQVELTVEQK